VPAVLAALLAALLYAGASVLQQRSAAAQSRRLSLRLGLLSRLATNPVWLLGVGCDVAGYAAQWVALGRGALVVVQPLLVSGLLFALPMSAALSGTRLRPRDWVAAVSVVAGLSLFLVVADPANGHDDVANSTWAALLLASTGLALVLATSGRRRSLRQQAVLYSAAAGVLYGVAAALTKACSHLLDHGLVHLLGHWQPWVLLVIGVTGMVVGQSAFQSGSLDVSLPTMTCVDPVVSVLIGAIAFGETMASSPPALLAETLGLVIMTVGVFALARANATPRPASDLRPSGPR
jgi:drug/metabolite transporter (DMT)-like permease